MQAEVVPFLQRLGDNALILGHRLSEWCGHAPVLEEDIALANTALDLIGQCRLWLDLAGEAEGKGRSADDLAMLRDSWEFRNLLLVEQPNGDFGQTIMRQYLFDAWHLPMLNALANCAQPRIAGVAAKSAREVAYHLARSRSLVIGLGDGTPESRGRMQTALDNLAPYVGEMLSPDACDIAAETNGYGISTEDVARECRAELEMTLASATLDMPDVMRSAGPVRTGGKSGRQHSEHLGRILSELQWLQRAYPGASW